MSCGGRIRAVSAAGGSFYLPERFDPFEIRGLLDKGEINAVSAVPSMWRLVLKSPEVIGTAGEKVRWIEIGSQYMTAEEKRGMKRLFPNARIVQHYGMTEASRSTFLVISDHDGDELESVGPPTGVEIGAGGEIRIRGGNVALGRLMEDGALVPLVDADGWLTTSDRGEIRDGYLYYLGRLDDQMNLAGIKVGAEDLEARVAALIPAARGHFAMTSVSDEMRGEAVLIAAEPPAAELLPLLSAATRHVLERKGVSAGGMLRSAALETLPRTATGKIRRAELKTCEPQHDPAPAGHAEEVTLSPEQARVAEVWQKVLGQIGIRPDNSFYDTGGDSLSGLQVGILMETAGFSRAAVNATFEGRPLAEVAALASSDAPVARIRPMAEPAVLPDKTRISWSLTLTRAVVVLSVLASHWSHGFFNAVSAPDWLKSAFWSFYRMGTPGFAMVFGIGVGLYMLTEVSERPGAVFHRMRRAFVLVMMGVTLMTLLHLVRTHLQGEALNGLTISNAIYSVLVYYAIMLGTARLWLPPLARLRHPVRDLLLLSLGLWFCWQLAEVVVPKAQLNSLLELPRLMLEANYNVFKLGAMSAAGMAAGYWISQQDDPAAVAGRLLFVGLAGSVFSMATLLQANGLGMLFRNSGLFTSLPGLAFYGSLCLLMMGAFLYIVSAWRRLHPVLQGPLRILLVIGGLALPIYAFHQLVLPGKDSLVLLGLQETLALALPMGVFLAIMFYLGRKTYRMYFP
jgi:hypothetical protein